MKKTVKQSRPDKIAEAVAQDCAHQSSAAVASRRRVLAFEAEELDKSVVAMESSIKMMKARRARIASIIAGLGAVIARR